ncbi:shikimate dehydrogenase [Thermasporomyces composti]|jgi:shikimate dehydrogenase|uniref:Shikimate dehydrogenase n=1 Tax=Thermasporomyces composti TaxID=696763 RepID=A0A3D9VJ61_THECX|nr:shikimate dehydrogenase [Thermasporomyces composti]REF38254.1 shikimate dehydrogenase [Thermasporomyces composti]
MGSPWGTGRRCAVLGSPIAHSLSPTLHQAAYARLGLDWRYDAFEVDEGGLPGFLDSLDPSWRGLSLTMPLKRVVIPLCDEVSELARRVGAVNTLLLDEGRRVGANTDVPGLVAALRERGVAAATSALLLGVGATACSAMAAFAELGIARVHAVARDPARAGELCALAADVGIEVSVVPWAEATEVPSVDLAVSTVPEAAAATLADVVAERADVVFDVLYHPWPTRLVVAAKAADRAVVGGLDLLVHQAAAQVELMTGCAPAPVAEMRAAGEAALEARGPTRGVVAGD